MERRHTHTFIQNQVNKNRKREENARFEENLSGRTAHFAMVNEWMRYINRNQRTMLSYLYVYCSALWLVMFVCIVTVTLQRPSIGTSNNIIIALCLCLRISDSLSYFYYLVFLFITRENANACESANREKSVLSLCGTYSRLASFFLLILFSTEHSVFVFEAPNTMQNMQI